MAAVKACAEAARTAFLRAPGAPRRVAHKAVTVRNKTVTRDAVQVRWDSIVRVVDAPTQPHFIARTTGRGGLGGLRHQNLSDTLVRRRSRRAGKLLLANLGGQQATGLTRGAINIPGVGPRAYARHRGTKGKHFVTAGKAAARRVVPNVYQRQVHLELARSLKG